MTDLIWYIHGANSTSKSFNYIRNKLPEHEAAFIEYKHNTSINEVISNMAERALLLAPRPIKIISHSLGGVIAIRIAQLAPNIEKVVTMSSPLGGVVGADMFKWFSKTYLMSDISPQNSNYASLRLTKPNADILSFVSKSGQFMGEETDGVVTVSSQRALAYPTYVNVDINHFEVLLSDEILDKTKDFLLT